MKAAALRLLRRLEAAGGNLAATEVHRLRVPVNQANELLQAGLIRYDSGPDTIDLTDAGRSVLDNHHPANANQ